MTTTWRICSLILTITKLTLDFRILVFESAMYNLVTNNSKHNQRIMMDDNARKNFDDNYGPFLERSLFEQS